MAPVHTFNWGGVRVQEQVLYIMAVTLVLTVALWALVRFTRIGLAITAAAENERAVQTLGLVTAGAVAVHLGTRRRPGRSCRRAGRAAHRAVDGRVHADRDGRRGAAALLGSFRSFPLTLLGGLVIGVGEALVTLYRGNIESFFHQESLTGLDRGVPFMVILLVLVVRGRGLPLRSHVTTVAELGTGALNVRRASWSASVVTLSCCSAVFDGRWAAAMFISLASAVVVLSVVVLTGYAGQVSLGQMAVAGMGAMFSGLLVDRAGWPMEIAVPIGIC